MNKQLIYLACPYTDKDPKVMEKRFMAVNRAAGKLMSEGEYIFSPISHTHPIAVISDLPRNWEFWEGFDRAYLSMCNKLCVLMLDGWENSTGVNAEIEIAKELGLEIEYLEEDF